MPKALNPVLVADISRFGGCGGSSCVVEVDDAMTVDWLTSCGIAVGGYVLDVPSIHSNVKRDLDSDYL